MNELHPELKKMAKRVKRMSKMTKPKKVLLSEFEKVIQANQQQGQRINNFTEELKALRIQLDIVQNERDDIRDDLTRTNDEAEGLRMMNVELQNTIQVERKANKKLVEGGGIHTPEAGPK